MWRRRGGGHGQCATRIRQFCLVACFALPLTCLGPGTNLATAWVGQPMPPARVRSALTRRATAGAEPLGALSVAIVGAGPSGLLLAHRLLQAGATVEIVEGRGDPRGADTEGRAYALGLGIRGRTAIRTVDNALWDAILPSGFASERFQLHFSKDFKIDLRSAEDNQGLEPSLLVYQSDLCGAMLEELESRYAATGRLRTTFKARATSVDPISGTVVISSPDDDGERKIGPMSLVAGCDGVNSVVRAAIQKACAGFRVEATELPGSLKVLRFPKMPAALVHDAVHAIPGKGGTSAFMEPTARGACALINWRNKKPEDEATTSVDFGAIADPEEAVRVLNETFPLLADQLDIESGKQFVAQTASRASTVRCNTYHYGQAALLGDAAHSTGGASGQGCNSALQDAAALADCLQSAGGDVPKALLEYSKSRVPEGAALLDLSVGPGPNSSPLQRILYGAASIRDAVLSRFGIGEKPLQTQLTTTLTSFAEIRRKRDFFFGEFPPAQQLNASIEELSKV